MNTVTNNIAILPGRLARSLVSFCSTDKGRPILHDVCLRDGYAYAMDGKRAVCWPLATTGKLNGRKVAPEHPEWRLSPKALRRRKVSESLALDLVGGSVAVLDPDGDVVVKLPPMTRFDPDNPNSVVGTYPDVDRVIPEYDAVCARLTVQARYLRDLAELLEDAATVDGLPMARVTLELTDGVYVDSQTDELAVGDPRRVIRFRLVDANGYGQTLGGIMPVVPLR